LLLWTKSSCYYGLKGLVAMDVLVTMNYKFKCDTHQISTKEGGV